MPHPTGPTNPELKKLAIALHKTKKKEYQTLAKMLTQPRRKKTAVNLFTIEEIAKHEGKDRIVVPWKVLGEGELSVPVNVYAWAFAKSARDKIIEAGGQCFTLADLLKEDPSHLVVLRDVTEREERE